MKITKNGSSLLFYVFLMVVLQQCASTSTISPGTNVRTYDGDFAQIVETAADEVMSMRISILEAGEELGKYRMRVAREGRLPTSGNYNDSRIVEGAADVWFSLTNEGFTRIEVKFDEQSIRDSGSKNDITSGEFSQNLFQRLDKKFIAREAIKMEKRE